MQAEEELIVREVVSKTEGVVDGVFGSMAG